MRSARVAATWVAPPSCSKSPNERASCGAAAWECSCRVPGATGYDVWRGGQRPLVGRIIDGKYRVIRPIGAGAWAEVYLAEHAQLQFQVAIKLLSNWQRCSDKQLER